MKVPRHIIAEAIAQRTEHISDKKLLAQEIAAYLLLENRTSDIESILRDIMQLRTDKGVLEAEIVSAHDVNDTVVNEVRELLKKHYPASNSVHVGKRHDSSVVGGLRVDMANQQLDMSVASKLATFKRIMSAEGSNL